MDAARDQQRGQRRCSRGRCGAEPQWAIWVESAVARRRAAPVGVRYRWSTHVHESIERENLGEDKLVFEMELFS